MNKFFAFIFGLFKKDKGVKTPDITNNNMDVTEDSHMPNYQFGKKSRARLDTCDVRLQEILEEAIKIVDFTVLEGTRNEERQNQLYSEGKSKLRWPRSKHNTYPSEAVDIAPYPIDWNDLVRFAHLVGIIRGIAQQKGIAVRSGIDWDNDGEIRDHRFLDFPHIELILE